MGQKKGELAGNSHVQRQISFKKELEVEELKIETPETPCPGQSLCPVYRVLIKKNDLNSSQNISNTIQI